MPDLALPPFLDQGGAALADQAGRLRLALFDFDGVFTDNAVFVLQDGSEMVRCTRADGVGLNALRALGIEAMVISTETNPVVQARATKLKLECHSGCADKRALAESLLHQRGLDWSQVSFLGNDVNDLACLAQVGLAVGVADSHPDIWSQVGYRTRTMGGHGAVREFCDIICRLRYVG